MSEQIEHPLIFDNPNKYVNSRILKAMTYNDLLALVQKASMDVNIEHVIYAENNYQALVTFDRPVTIKNKKSKRGK